LFVAANNITGKNGTCFSVVRYGNVVGSRGSVVPFFKHLIKEGATELPVTDEQMTRFWITLPQGIDFVISNFHRMMGGEIFIPKIPSMRIMDLVKSIAPELSVKFIGIRAGEKLHEILCPKDDSHLTIEFTDHFVISPSITFTNKSNNFSKNQLDEKGIPVKQGFEYESGTNPHFLTVKELQQYGTEQDV
jgi:UDP-N-acetylglucosamine 4,6-dehydratase